MSLELWFREDARAVVLSVTVAALQGAVANGAPTAAYCQGVMDSARACCVAFHVDFSGFVADLRALLASHSVLGVLQDAGVDLVAGNGALWQVQGR